MALTTDYDRATELVHEIGSLIVRNDRYASRDWDGIAVTVIIEPGATQISGYSYVDGKDPEAGSPGLGVLADRFEELCAAMQNPDGSKWKTALVRIRRDTGKITIDYDYENPLRWKVTPLNLGTLPEEMRPK